jgi:hypothetical protein
MRSYYLLLLAFMLGFGVGQINRKPTIIKQQHKPLSIVIIRPTTPCDHPTDQANSHIAVALELMQPGDNLQPKQWCISIEESEQKFTHYFSKLPR